MQVTSGSVSFAATHQAFQAYQKKESLEIRFNAPESRQTAPQEMLLRSLTPPQPPEKSSERPELDSLSSQDQLKVLVLEKFIESITGKPFQFQLADFDHDQEQIAADIQKAFEPVLNPQATSGGPLGWGIEYQARESYQESETIAFAAKGVIVGSDGEEVAFELNLQMSRELLIESELRVQAGDAVRLVDPLVINWGRPAAALEAQRFKFDLDADGTSEDIARLAEGSGFLALDRNQDGTINNGTELFGPRTGQGFSELAELDENQNGWIDSKDSVFSKLRIWSVDAQGKSKLSALGEKGVGAIYLGHLDTPFQLKDASGLQTLGQVRATGIYLGQERAGSVQMLDLAV
jgi:hypothetical protein